MTDIMTDDDRIAEDLADLRRHWSGAYVIHYFRRPGLWLAQRRDDHTTIKAGDAETLRTRIRADYTAHPVPRQRDAT